jgi:hypothetical protein
MIIDCNLAPWSWTKIYDFQEAADKLVDKNTYVQGRFYRGMMYSAEASAHSAVPQFLFTISGILVALFC